MSMVAKVRLMVASAAIVALGVVTGVSPAGATTITVHSGALSATFTYTGSYSQSHNPHLTIKESGKVVYSAAVSSSLCGNSCWPEQVNTTSGSALHLANLENNGHLDVVLDLYSGGAHCCSIEQVFSHSGSSGSFKKTERNFGDPGATLKRLGSSRQQYFLTADDRFAYAFTDYAASGMPVQVFKFSNHAFVDVTRNYPALIASDAAFWLKTYQAQASSHYPDSVGLIAAWAADEDMLGHWATVQAFLDHEAAAGHLISALSPIEPSGKKFVAALDVFLRKYGYLH